MAVHFSGSFFAKSLLASALATAVATSAMAQSVKPETESNPISPSVQIENGSAGKMEHHRIGDGKPHHAGKHHKGDHKRGHHRMGNMRHAAIVIPGLGGGSQKLVDDLKLTDEQKTTLKTIQDEQKAAREPNREAFRQYKEERRKQLESGDIDPKALLAAQKDMRDGFEKKHADEESKWLGLWDTFNADQKATVVKYFKERSAKWEEHRKQFEEKRAAMKEAQKTDAAATPAANSTPAAEAPKQ